MFAPAAVDHDLRGNLPVAVPGTSGGWSVVVEGEGGSKVCRDLRIDYEMDSCARTRGGRASYLFGGFDALARLAVEHGRRVACEELRDERVAEHGSQTRAEEDDGEVRRPGRCSRSFKVLFNRFARA